MRLNLGIRAQLTAGIVITTLAGIGLIGLLAIKIVENSAVYWKASESIKIVKIIKAASERPSPSADPSGTLKFIGDIFVKSGINDFQIKDSSGKSLMQEGVLPKEPGEDINSGDIKVRKIGGGFFRGPGEMLFVSTFLDGKNIRGAVEFTVPLKEINEDMAGVRKFLLLYALLDSLVIIIFGVYFLSRSITAPLRKLEEAATRIAGGKLFERAQVSVDNEVGSLAESFNIMAERLENEIKSLERVNMELLSAQEEVLRSSTLAAVGRLAAGIAHEIGNPLGAVRGYLDILEKDPSDKEEEKEIIERAAKEVGRIDAIVREFLEIARPSRKTAEPVDVSELIKETVADLSVHKDLSGIEARLTVKEGLPRVAIDEGKLRQVFINLLINAAHSMINKEGIKAVEIDARTEKRATERMARRRKDDPPFTPDEIREREYVVISFRDFGIGISEEDSKRIFDPFFTTKDLGKGTGLGLFVSQTIIKTYGGNITLDSRPGEGSTFTVALPSWPT